MNLKEIKGLIELVDEKGFAEFELKRKGFRLRISRFKESNQHAAQSDAPIIISSSMPGSEILSPAGRRGLIEAQFSPAAAPEAPSAPTDQKEAAEKPELHVIKSPIVGTFYSAPSPTSGPFVRVGDEVEPETVVCIIEAMKLMNEIQAEVRGEVARIYVEDGQPIEYGQALFGIVTR